jgi:short-subunit dehydrogenase
VTAELPLHGRVLLVTGAGRGLGRAIARGAACLGADLALLARTKSDLEAVRDEIERDTGRAALVIPADVRDSVAVGAAIEAAGRRFGGVDAGIYNAGVGYWEPIVATPEERWDETLDVNLKGAFLFTRALLPAMLVRGGGQLVFVSSRIAAEPIANYGAYAASKAGLRAFAEVVTKEVGGRGVRVTTVIAGLIDTGFSDVPHGRPRDQRPPAELMLTVDEVADQILNVLRAPANAWVKELYVYPARL